MDPQEALQRQKKSLESAEFERKLFEEQAADLEAAIEARREEMKRAGDQAQAQAKAKLWGDIMSSNDSENNSNYDEEQERLEQSQIDQAQANQIAEADQAQSQDDAQEQHNQTFLDRARSFLREEGHEIDNEDLKKLAKEKPQRPGFPTGMLMLAILKDTLDVILTLSFIGILISWMYAIPYFFVYLDWTMSRVNKVSFAGKFVIKKIRKKVVKKIARSGLEVIPILQVLPLATFFVVLDHYADTKLVQVFVKAAEMLEGMDFGD